MVKMEKLNRQDGHKYQKIQIFKKTLDFFEMASERFGARFFAHFEGLETL